MERIRLPGRAVHQLSALRRRTRYAAVLPAVAVCARRRAGAAGLLVLPRAILCAIAAAFDFTRAHRLPFFPVWIVLYARKTYPTPFAFFTQTLKIEVQIAVRKAHSASGCRLTCRATGASSWFSCDLRCLCANSPCCSRATLTRLTAAAAFYFALLLPGVPFALIAWKMQDDMDDWDDFFEKHLPAWFIFLCLLIFVGPALAIGRFPAVFTPSRSHLLTAPSPLCCSRGLRPRSSCCPVGCAALSPLLRLEAEARAQLRARPSRLFFRICGCACCSGAARPLPFQRSSVFHYPRRSRRLEPRETSAASDNTVLSYVEQTSNELILLCFAPAPSAFLFENTPRTLAAPRLPLPRAKAPPFLHSLDAPHALPPLCL
jgi:hypothetical protein